MCQIKYEVIVEKATEFDKLPQQLNIFHIKYSIKLPTKALVPDVYAPFWHFSHSVLLNAKQKATQSIETKAMSKNALCILFFPLSL